MSSLTPEMFDLLIIVVIIFGVALAVVRLYADFSRRLAAHPKRDLLHAHDKKS